MWPFTAALGLVRSYNLLMVIDVLTSALATFVLLRRWTSKLWIALIGGALFGFSPYMVSEASTGHPTLLGVAAVPLLFLALEEIFVDQNWHPRTAGLLLGGFALVQLLTAEEVLLDCVILAVAGAILLVSLNRGLNGRSGQHIVVALGWALVFAPIGLAFVGYQFLGPGAIHGQALNSEIWNAPLVSFFVPTNQQLLAVPSWSTYVARVFANGPELGAYLGLPLIALVIWTALRQRDRRSRWLVVMIVLVAILSLGAHLHLNISGHAVSIPLPGDILNKIPVVSSLLPMRLALYVDLFCVLLMARAMESLTGKKRPIVTVTFVAVLVAAWLPSWGVIYLPQVIPSYFTSSRLLNAVPAGASVLVLPYTAGPFDDRAMLWQAASDMRFRMPEGYGLRASWTTGGDFAGPVLTAFTGPLVEIEFGIRPPRVTPSGQAAALAYLRAHRVVLVVLGPSPYTRTTHRYINDVLGLTGHRTDGVWVWRLNGLAA
jgi:hypothetical protein